MGAGLDTIRNQLGQGEIFHVEGVQGEQYSRGSINYDKHNYQYSTSSNDPRLMNPSLIIYPKNINDIKMVIEYVKEKKIALAIRTGGHQYSGASSTFGKNILIDLSKTFENDIEFDQQKIKDKIKYKIKRGETLVRTSISWKLIDFNEELGSKGLFVPHGQCSDVYLGGHCQTGGYGQLGRSFGLFGDHIIAIEIIDSNGKERTIFKDDEDGLFYAILGGSPGNFGVLTHLTLKVYKDSDYKGSLGLKCIYWYTPETLKKLLNILVSMANNKDFPRNYDYCVNVLSSTWKFPLSFHTLVEDMEKLISERIENGTLGRHESHPIWPRMIVVYAQYVPFDGGEYNAEWFDEIRELAILNEDVKLKPMSELTNDWIFKWDREFDHPYIKRTYLTKSETLVEDKWVDWVTKRIDEIVAPSFNRCWLCVQIQNFGGNFSKVFQNRNNGTSYSWRDSTIVCILDCFYDEEDQSAKEIAEEWQKKNDMEGIGPNGKFSVQDRRVLWGSYDSHDLNISSKYYYDDKAKYDKLCKIKKKVDPDGIFTPNSFCVGGSHHKHW